MTLRCTTNKELWDYQSSFLNNRSIVLFDKYGEEHRRYNVAAVYYYLAKNALPWQGEGHEIAETKYLQHLIKDHLMKGDEIFYYGFRAQLTDEPYPRILSDGDPEYMDYVLVKRLDDIPILCKANFNGQSAYQSIQNIIYAVPRAFDMDKSGITYWGEVNTEPDRNVHVDLGDGRYVHGDIVMTGEISDDVPLVEEFDLGKYLTKHRPVAPLPDFVMCKYTHPGMLGAPLRGDILGAHTYGPGVYGQLWIE